MTAPRLYPLPYETAGATWEQIAEDVANSERARLGMGDGPAPDLRDRLANQVGIRIFYFKMPSKIAGVFAYNEPLGACIAINLDHPADRRNWSLAHEYGHFLTARFQPEVTFLFEKRRLSARERLADGFAECFLMPATGINRRITELHRSLPSGITLAHFVELANFYQVSVQALIKRLEALKRLPYGTWERLKEEGFKVRRAQEMLNLNPQATVVEGMPRHYVTMAVYAFRKGLITEGELARLLRVDRLTAREEVQRHTDPLHSEEEGFAAVRIGPRKASCRELISSAHANGRYRRLKHAHQSRRHRPARRGCEAHQPKLLHLSLNCGTGVSLHSLRRWSTG